MSKFISLVLLCLVHCFAFAQVIDNNASFRLVNAAHYLRIHYENDYFSGSDQYYTQGVNVELVAPVLTKNPVNKMLILPKRGTRQFGIALDHAAYTPTSIRFNSILYGDRPFAAYAMAKSFASVSDAAKRTRITSALSIGLIGKVAGAYEIQKAIHRWIGDTDPKGWQYQIKNDVIINYEAAIEKNIFAADFLLVNGFTALRAGTLSDKFSLGAVLMAGKFNNATSVAFKGKAATAEKQKFTFHFYAQPVMNVIGYDATLQGGLLFNRDSPYTLSSKEIERLTFQGNTGFVFNIGATYIEYYQSVLSKEFETGQRHNWGGVRIGLLF